MDNDVQGERKAGMRLSSCVFIAVVFSLSSAVFHAREAWRFLPCFGNDVRGIERHAVAEGRFFGDANAGGKSAEIWHNGTSGTNGTDGTWH